MRVATMPSAHGESAVLRLLSRENTLLDLPRLGMSAADQAKLLRHVNASFGLIIVTGPTGSGKTTTLAAALSRIANGARKIVTVEDPIEYQIPSIIQTQVQPAIGLTFSRALRAYLRQDPDVMMIGEIRDAETAEIAIQAALTGHLVLSSLHTNTAAAAVARLLDMGVESYLLAATLRCAVGQRLVRRLCERCRARETGSTERSADETLFLRSLGVDEGERFYRAVGCPSCNGIGYKSRVGVFEVLTVDEPVRQEIVPHASTAAIETAGRKFGMRTMLEDGLARCRVGETTVEEVLRVAASI
jgi:general secretion pathway protein E